MFVVAKEIHIGQDCRIGTSVHMFDSPGHPLNAADRRAGRAARDIDVRPIRIGNNVWIGSGAVIFPGVTVGDDSVIAAHAVVTADVPPGVLMIGNPARRVMAIGTESST
jgi:maltose O-acetyltransferase